LDNIHPNVFKIKQFDRHSSVISSSNAAKSGIKEYSVALQ